MAERLTMQDERGTAILKETDMKDRCEYCYEAIQKLSHYEDLEEQGRLVILPEGMNLRKLLDILTEYSPGCPSDYNLTNRCELSCFECWLAALKGAENDNL